MVICIVLRLHALIEYGSSVTSVIYILRFTKHILKDSSYKKLAYIRKYYSIIVCEMHQYIKRHLNRHHDASLGHSPNNFCNLRYITINFWCLFRNYQFVIKHFRWVLWEPKNLFIFSISNSTCRYRAWFGRCCKISMQ